MEVGVCRLAHVGSSRDNPGNLFDFIAGLRRDVVSFKWSVGDKVRDFDFDFDSRV